jgi:lysophospholipase L1-like esterase
LARGSHAKHIWPVAGCRVFAPCAGGLRGGASNPGGQSSAAPASSPSAQAVRVVALGDSDATGTGDPTGQGWVGRYAALVKATGSVVHVTNLASDGKTSDVLLTEVRSDPATRQALRGAQVVLLGIGGADPNRGDEDLQAGRCKGGACYTPLLRPVRPQLRRDSRHRSPAGWPLRIDPGD